jgi:putative SOS response-associated peptidase YedK
MCGRAYNTYTDEELWMRYVNDRSRRNPLAPLPPNYNLSPTHQTPVVYADAEGQRQLGLFAWGLIPAWSPEFKTKLSTINAKSETVFESRLYKGAVARRRCIVPVSGFFEWKRDGERKRPFRIFLKDEPIMSLAGVWEAWRPGTPEERRSFSILTTAANAFMSAVHDRMPVILGREEEQLWLDPALRDPAPLLKPCPDDWLEKTEVSTLVNSPRNNIPEVLLPVQQTLVDA